MSTAMIELNASDYQCAEASVMSREFYIPCGCKATCFVRNGDRKAYPMCDGCRSHNVKNRGGRVVHPVSVDEIATADTVKQSLQVGTEMIESKPASQAKETILFSVTEATARPMVEKYLALTISGVDDKAGIAAVRAARQDVRNARTTVDKEREAAKRYYLEEGRKIDGSAKIVWAILEPAELHLVAELTRIDVENQRLADEKLDRQLDLRLIRLGTVGGVSSTVSQQFPNPVIRAMTDERFAGFVDEMASLNLRLAAEAKERAEAEERNRLEAEKLAEERAELDRLRKAEAERQQAEKKRLDEERRIEDARIEAKRAEERRADAENQKRLDAQRAEQQKRDEEERRSLEATRLANQKETDRIEAERKKLADEQAAKLRAEQLAVEEKRKADAAEAKRLEDEKSRAAMLPHKEKLVAYRDALLAVPVPKLPAKLRGTTELLDDLRLVITNSLNSLSESVEKTR